MATDPERPDLPDPRLGCNSPACVAALAAVVTARNVVVFKCGQVAAAVSRRNAMSAAAGALFVLAAALAGAGAAAFAAGGPVGIVAAIVLWVLAVTALATGILFGIFAAIGEIQVGVLNGELNAARSEFITATEGVTAACPTECWGDLTMPSC